MPLSSRYAIPFFGLALNAAAPAKKTALRPLPELSESIEG